MNRVKLLSRFKLQNKVKTFSIERRPSRVRETPLQLEISFKNVKSLTKGNLYLDSRVSPRSDVSLSTPKRQIWVWQTAPLQLLTLKSSLVEGKNAE